MRTKGVNFKVWVEPKYTTAEYCDDLENTWMVSAWKNIPMLDGDYSTTIGLWANKNNLIKCKKSEATSMLIVGEKEKGCWITGKHKNYYFKLKN